MPVTGAAPGQDSQDSRHSDGITAVILAGGRGSRFGGQDKGLQLLAGRPLVAHVLERIAPQVDEVLINANRNLDAYRRFGPRVIADATEGFPGPLAGLQRALDESIRPWVVTAPCDVPFLPRDLVARLLQANMANDTDIAVATTGGRTQPVFSLCARSLLPSLNAFLAAGGRKVDAWHASLRATHVPFDDDPSAFENINTAADLARIAARP